MAQLPTARTARRSRPMSSALERMNEKMNELLRRASMMLLGDDGRPAPIERLESGVGALDALLDGGLAKGRLVEVYGAPGSGKTGLALALAAGVQRAGGAVAFVDAEGSLDPARAQRAGVDLERLVAARPRMGEEALQIVDALLKTRATDLIIVDSVAALVPRAELIAPLGEAPQGLHAKLMSTALRRVVAQATASGAVVMFLNQQRTTFDDEGKAFLTTTGGHALHFYAATRLEVKRRDADVLVRVVKDRFGAEGRAGVVALGEKRGFTPS